MNQTPEKRSAAAALKSLADDLAAEVLGQRHVVDPVAEWVIDGELGLNPKGRPRGSFFFLGPTGVGKTQLAKALAARLVPGSRPIAFDMSEFQTKGSVDIFLGQGGDDIGRFGKMLRAGKGSLVLLFDEVEKAYSTILDLFLQVMAEGRLTVSSGEVFDLRAFYIIYTSNIGGAAAARMRHNSEVAIERTVLAAARQNVRPEFFARMDLVCCFRRLGLQIQEEVCRLHVDRKIAELAADGMAVSVEPAVYQWLLGEGFSELDGARPLERAIQRHINQPVRHAWLSGREPHGVLRVNADQSALEFGRSGEAAA